jgi:hypothetical protein
MHMLMHTCRKAPAGFTVLGAHELGESQNIHSIRICCEFFQTGFHSSFRKQYYDIGHLGLVSNTESGTKIWHAVFDALLKLTHIFCVVLYCGNDWKILYAFFWVIP